jgi:hypothetical protein
MSLSEIKEEIPRLNKDDLSELDSFVKLAQARLDPAWLQEAEQINARMARDPSACFSEADLRALHRQLGDDPQ